MVQSTTYLHETEYVALKRIAAEHGTSLNYIVRVAVRYYLGLSVPDTLEPDRARWSKVE